MNPETASRWEGAVRSGKTMLRMIPGGMGTVAAGFVLSLSMVGAAWSAERRGAETLGPASVEQGGSETIAHRILKLEAGGGIVEAAVVQTLNRVLEDTCTAVRQVKRHREDRWDPRYVEAILRSIDAALIRQGMVYPDTGAMDRLSESLSPFQMTAERRLLFQLQPQNQRRLERMAERFPGPFYAADCDTVSFLYLGVAERLDLPLALVTIPSRDRRPGHAFVRWREGTHHLNWETMEGAVRTDGSYIKPWRIAPAAIQTKAALADLTPDQVMGFVHSLLAIRYERQGKSEQALGELATALRLHPENLDARREFAWITATGAELKLRDHDTALRHINYVLKIMEDPDARDTLAAVHASAGRFAEAVREERKAIRDSSTAARAGYRSRLGLYEQGKVYRRLRR